MCRMPRFPFNLPGLINQGQNRLLERNQGLMMSDDKPRDKLMYPWTPKRMEELDLSQRNLDLDTKLKDRDGFSILQQHLLSNKKNLEREQQKELDLHVPRHPFTGIYIYILP